VLEGRAPHPRDTRSPTRETPSAGRTVDGEDLVVARCDPVVAGCNDANGVSGRDE